MKQERIFGKSQLRNGMVLEFKDGRKGLLLKEVITKNNDGENVRRDIIKFERGFSLLENFDENLKGKIEPKSDHIIDRVYEIAFWGKDINNILNLDYKDMDYACVWERKVEEKEDTETDWTKVKELTPVEGYYEEEDKWLKGYFLEYREGKIIIAPIHPLLYAMANIETGIAAAFDKARIIEEKEEIKIEDALLNVIMQNL